MAEILCTLGCTLLVKYRMLKTQKQQTAVHSKAVASVASELSAEAIVGMIAMIGGASVSTTGPYAGKIRWHFVSSTRTTALLYCYTAK